MINNFVSNKVCFKMVNGKRRLVAKEPFVADEAIMTQKIL